MFDIEIFKEMPDLFYSFARELYPDTTEVGGTKRAGVVHKWIRSLEQQNKLLRNYTQNIDTLERVAGIEKVLYAHGECRATRLSFIAKLLLLVFLIICLHPGSFATCSCIICHSQYPGEQIREA